MKRGSCVAAVLVCLAAAGGCASPARIVSLNKQDGTGTVAIPANTDSWPTHYRTAAEELITKEVGPYRIVSEGEFVKGKRKQISLDSNSASFTQEKITEYRITFVRATAPVVPPVPPDGAGPIPAGARVPAPGPLPGAAPGGAP